jgi:DnaK suppressor protein
MSDLDLNFFKTELQKRQNELRGRLAQLRGGDLTRSNAAAELFNYAEDSDAQVNAEKDLTLAMDAHESAELDAIAAALFRIEKNEFGQCMDCGEPIAKARLLAFPEASRCVECQTRHEGHS